MSDVLAKIADYKRKEVSDRKAQAAQEAIEVRLQIVPRRAASPWP
jgi:hypothetical protein